MLAIGKRRVTHGAGERSTQAHRSYRGSIVWWLLLAYLGLIFLLLLGYEYRWTGFGQQPLTIIETTHYKGSTVSEVDIAQSTPPPKTLWDWWVLLIPAAVAAIGAYLTNTAQEVRHRADLEVQDQSAQDAALQAYLDYISQLLTE